MLLARLPVIGRSAATRERASRFRDAGSVEALAAEAALILSVCPPHAALDGHVPQIITASMSVIIPSMQRAAEEQQPRDDGSDRNARTQCHCSRHARLASASRPPAVEALTVPIPVTTTRRPGFTGATLLYSLGSPAAAPRQPGTQDSRSGRRGLRG